MNENKGKQINTLLCKLFALNEPNKFDYSILVVPDYIIA